MNMMENEMKDEIETAEYKAKIRTAESKIIEALKGFNQFEIRIVMNRVDFEVKSKSLMP